MLFILWVHVMALSFSFSSAWRAGLKSKFLSKNQIFSVIVVLYWLFSRESCMLIQALAALQLWVTHNPLWEKFIKFYFQNHGIASPVVHFLYKHWNILWFKKKIRRREYLNFCTNPHFGFFKRIYIFLTIRSGDL